MSAVRGPAPFAVIMANANKTSAIRRNMPTQFLLFSPKRRAVDLMPAMASSSLS